MCLPPAGVGAGAFELFCKSALFSRPRYHRGMHRASGLMPQWSGFSGEEAAPEDDACLLSPLGVSAWR